MNLQQMVQLAGADPRYLKFKSPRDARVVEAMARVDRREFLPGGVYEEKAVLPFFLYCEIEDVVRNLTPQRAGEKREFTQEEAEYLFVLCKGILTLSSEARVPVRDIAYDLWTPSIGYGQTCSEPGMVAVMVDLLELQPGQRVLEIGTGCGYHAAVTAELVGSEGIVYSMERILPLAEMARAHLKHHFGEDHGKERVVVVYGDGSRGLPEHAPFDRIYFTAGVDPKRFDSQVFHEQLQPGGILLFPEVIGRLIKMYKNGAGVLEERQHFGKVHFVPLVHGALLNPSS